MAAAASISQPEADCVNYMGMAGSTKKHVIGNLMRAPQLKQQTPRGLLVQDVTKLPRPASAYCGRNKHTQMQPLARSHPYR
jgi:hypothetical protein